MADVTTKRQSITTTTMEFSDTEVRQIVLDHARGAYGGGSGINAKIIDDGARYEGNSLSITVQITKEEVS